MHLAWKKEIRRRTTILLVLVATGAGIAMGSYAGLVAQVVVVEVYYPGATETIPWTCAIQVNNDPTFENYAGSGTHTLTFYYVHNILAACSKADNSFYSISVTLKTGTGQVIGPASGYPTATIHWIRPSSTCSPTTQCPLP